MRLPVSIWIALISFQAVTPAAAARHGDAQVNCASDVKIDHRQSDMAVSPPKAAGRSRTLVECEAGKGAAQADLQIYGLFILGMLVIGIPAVRRRQARVVFS